jgi:hypothetical protein
MFMLHDAYIALTSNTTSLSAVDDAFPETGDDSHQKQTPTVTHDIDQASDVVEGGREDNLKFVKQEITRQAGMCDHCHSSSFRLIYPASHQPNLAAKYMAERFSLGSSCQPHSWKPISASKDILHTSAYFPVKLTVNMH